MCVVMVYLIYDLNIYGSTGIVHGASRRNLYCSVHPEGRVTGAAV